MTVTSVQGCHSKNENTIVYSSLPSANRPTPSGKNLPVLILSITYTIWQEVMLKVNLIQVQKTIPTNDVYQPEYTFTPQHLSQCELMI